VAQTVRLCEICGQNGTGVSSLSSGFSCQYRSDSALFFTRVLVPERQAAEAVGTLKQSGASSDIGEEWARKITPSPFFNAPKMW
jgi:hypothetical protein